MEQANSILSYLQLLERYSNYKVIFYRGQLERFPNILPSIARDEGYIINESSIFYEAVKMKEDEFSQLLSPLQKLSKLQHYGIPTRLVDVTINPLIALYFAVENVDDTSNGNVFVYIKNAHSFGSEHARLLSLFATLPNHDINNIILEYKRMYNHDLSINKALKYINEPVFIKYCNKLKLLNPRLYNQFGTFLICGNEISNRIVTNKLKSLDTLEPNMIIRIPYEFKQMIKDELDKKYEISNVTIYPELPSVADYIKSKYKKENFSIDGKYSIVQIENTSHAFARRVSIIVVLNDQLRIDNIRTIAISIIDKYKESQDVVWVYIAKTGEDYILSNWVLRGQWISSSLDKKYRPLTLGEEDEQGYYWESNNYYSTLADYYDKYVFDTDKNLFVYHCKVWNEFTPIYDILLQSHKDTKKFIDDILEHTSQISKLYMLIQEFGHSKNKDFDDFLYNYDYAISAIDDLHYWLENTNLNDSARQYQFMSCLNRAKKHADIINEKSLQWRDKIGVSSEDFSNINPYCRPKHEYQYIQTLPISSTALNVNFDVSVTILADKRIQIHGTTNLFDRASIMLTVVQDGRILGQDTTDVLNGKFCFSVFGSIGKGYMPGEYKAEISLSIPSVQPKEFVELAGIEYENLCGTLVKRTGIGPGVNYEYDFMVD